MMSDDFPNFIPSTNKQETNKYHSLEFVHCSDWLFQPILADFSADLRIGRKTKLPKTIGRSGN